LWGGESTVDWGRACAKKGSKDFMQSDYLDACVAETACQFHSHSRTVSGEWDGGLFRSNGNGPQFPGRRCGGQSWALPTQLLLFPCVFLFLLVGQHADTIIPEPDPVSFLFLWVSSAVCNFARNVRSFIVADASTVRWWSFPKESNSDVASLPKARCGPLSGERIREGDQALPSSITVGTGQTGTLQQ
jgi:hypothetical protein